MMNSMIILQELIHVQVLRIRGYSKAMQELSFRDQPLKVLFTETIRESTSMHKDLMVELEIAGAIADDEVPDNERITAKQPYPVSLFPKHHRKEILRQCKAVEDIVQVAYSIAVFSKDFIGSAAEIVCMQQNELNIAYDNIKFLYNDPGNSHNKADRRYYRDGNAANPFG